MTYAIKPQIRLRHELTEGQTDGQIDKYMECRRRHSEKTEQVNLKIKILFSKITLLPFYFQLRSKHQTGQTCGNNYLQINI